MAAATTLDDHQLARLRELRAAGSSPKQIARTLGVRPAVVAPLIRRIAQEQADARSEPPVVGCWVNPGWSDGLGVDGHDDWLDPAPHSPETAGLVGVLVARRDRPRRVSVHGFLVDVYCLGVKDVLGPRLMKEDDLPVFRREFFAAFGDGAGIEAPLELARHLVWGAVEFARDIGFAPAREFAAASAHLGAWTGTSDITFGRHGEPFYVQGPFDDPSRVITTLTAAR